MSQSTKAGTAVLGQDGGGPMVVIEDLHRSYGTGASAVHALRGVSFEVPRGELVALKGRSGSGKTTLLNLVGGSTNPTAGASPSTDRTSPDSARTGCWNCAVTASASYSSPSA